MPELDLAELRNIAEQPTPGPWENDNADPGVWGPDHIVIGNYTAADQFDSPMWEDGTPEDRAHIAAFDPPTTLALLDRIDALSGDLKTAMQEHAHWQERAENAERELTQLRAGRGKWKGTTDA